jgi:hypothetical protein
MAFGELRLAGDESERARRSFEDAVRAAEELASLFPTTDSRLALARSLLALGRYHSVQGDREGALACYRRARDDLQALKDREPENPDVKRCLALVLWRAGDALFEIRRLTDSLGARHGAGSLWEGLEEAQERRRGDPAAEEMRRRKWDAEAACREVTWELFKELPDRAPTPSGLATIDAAVEKLDPVEPAARPLTTLPDRLAIKAIAFLPRGDDPFVVFRLRGEASHGGRFSGTARCLLIHGVKGLGTVSTLHLDFGEGDSVEVWGLGFPADNRDTLTGEFVLRNGKGSLAGVTGAGRFETESLRGMDLTNMRTFEGPCVRLAYEGTIHRLPD